MEKSPSVPLPGPYIDGHKNEKVGGHGHVVQVRTTSASSRQSGSASCVLSAPYFQASSFDPRRGPLTGSILGKQMTPSLPVGRGASF